MFCKNCGKEIMEGVAFCDGCGSLVKKEEPKLAEEISPADIIKEIEAEVEMEKMAEPEMSKFCPKCGKSLPQSALFCGGCGYSYNEPNRQEVSKSPVPPKPIRHKKKGNGGIVAIIIVLIIAILGVGGVYAYREGYLDSIFAGEKDNDKEDKKEDKKDQKDTEEKEDAEDNEKEEDAEEVEDADEKKDREKAEDEDAKKNDDDWERCDECGAQKVKTKDGEQICISCDIKDEEEESEEGSDEEDMAQGQSGYLFPSDRKLITKQDLLGMSKEQVALIRNEIYARHGYIFQSEEYQDYFGKKDWYQPDPSFAVDSLNAIETANKDFLVKYEEDMGWR